VTPAAGILGIFTGILSLRQALMQLLLPTILMRICPTSIIYAPVRGLKMVNGKIIDVIHFNDYPSPFPREQQKDKDRVYPGDGVAPLNRLFRDLAGMGGTKVLSLELFNLSTGRMIRWQWLKRDGENEENCWVARRARWPVINEGRIVRAKAHSPLGRLTPA